MQPPAEESAELVQLKRRLLRGGAIEEIFGIEVIVSQEVDQTAMVIARAGLVGEIDGASAATAELCIGHRAFDAKLLHGFDWRKDQNAEAVVILVVVDAVEQEIVLLKTRAIDGIAGDASFHRDGTARLLALRRHCARRQSDELGKVAAVEGKIFDRAFGAEIG